MRVANGEWKFVSSFFTYNESWGDFVGWFEVVGVGGGRLRQQLVLMAKALPFSLQRSQWMPMK